MGADVVLAIRRNHVKIAVSARCLVIALSLALSTTAVAQEEESASAAPSADDMAKAKEAFAQGKELFDKGELLSAAKAFKKSYRLSKNPILLYNIGFTTDKLGKTDLAIFYYEKFLKEAPETAPFRKEATDRLEELKSQKTSEDAAAKEKAEADAKAAVDAKAAADAKAKQKATKSKAKGKGKAKAKADAGAGFEHNIIEEAPPGKPLDVTAFVPKDSGWEVTLFYRLPGISKYTKVAMRPRYAELVGRISAAATTKATSIQYYVEARADGEVVARSGQPTSPHLITIDKDAKPRYYPDLDDQENWSEAPMARGGSTDHSDVQHSKYFWHKWGSTGGAAAMLALSVSFYLVSADANDTLEGEANASLYTDACPDKPCRAYSKIQQDLQDRGKRFETLGNIALGLGAASAVAAGVFWYLDAKNEGGSNSDSYDPDSNKPLAKRLRFAPIVRSSMVGGAAQVRF